MNEFPKHTRILYKDAIRTIKLFVDHNRQDPMLKYLRNEFERNRKVKNETEILKLKKLAANGILNLYVTNVKSKLNYTPPNPFEKRINF